MLLAAATGVFGSSSLLLHAVNTLAPQTRVAAITH